MSIKRVIRGSIITLTCCGMLSAQLAQAAAPQISAPTTRGAAAQPAIRDVALADAGTLRGQVIDSQGAAHAEMTVAFIRDGQEVARTQTDANGRFEVQNLTGGVYEIQTPNGGDMYRVWAPRTAPPSADSAVTIIPEQTVVRGQFRQGGRALGWLANPWVLAAIVAAAIAIPLALDNDSAS